MLDRLNLDAGVRYDSFSSFGSSVNPRVALIHQATDSTTFKAVYGTAFRAPNVLEVFLEPSLDPETIDTYELIWEQEYEGAEMRSTVSLFYNQIDDLITRDGGVVRNLAAAETVGIEVGWLAFWLDGQLQTRASYTYQETEDDRSGLSLTDSPHHLGKVSASLPVYQDQLFANLEFQYMSGRTTLGGTETAGFGLLNFNLYSQDLPIDGLSISVGAFNILDRRYEDPAPLFSFLRQRSIEQDGRTFYVKMNYSF